MREPMRCLSDAGFQILLILALLLLPGCCVMKAAEIGVLSGFSIYTPEERDAAMTQLHRECPTSSTESKAGPKSSLACSARSSGSEP